MAYNVSRADPGFRGFSRHPRAILTGACADLADRFGVPIWAVRLGVLLAFTQWSCTVAALYVLSSVALRTRLAALLPAAVSRAVSPARGASTPPRDRRADDDFSRLEQRLARLEAAVTSEELRLRARFRDIGG